MDKQSYFQKCMDHGCYRSKAWVISAFSVVLGMAPSKRNTFLTDEEVIAEKLRIKRDEKGNPFFNDPDTDSVVYIEHVQGKENTAVFSFKDPVKLKSGACDNLTRDVETTYGAWLYNNIVVVYPFGKKIPFSANGYTIPELEKIIESRLVDDPDIAPDGSDDLFTPIDVEIQTDPTKAKITVSEYIRYNEAAGALTGYTQLCVPAATPFTMTISPEVIKRRDELFEEYKDRLHDPAVQARIFEELVAMDKAWNATDPDKGFYYTSKSFDVVRKKLFISQGSESGFGKTGEFIKTSLVEGAKAKDLPAIANASRSGSYSRGALTALGGEDTKFSLRIFQNSTTMPGDCGTKITAKVDLNKFNVAGYVGYYMTTSDGLVELTEENIKPLIGQTINVRSPRFCNQSRANYCSICVGAKLAQTPEAIPTNAGEVGSTFMGVSMSAMHGSKLATARFEPTVWIT